MNAMETNDAFDDHEVEDWRICISPDGTLPGDNEGWAVWVWMLDLTGGVSWWDVLLPEAFCLAPLDRSTEVA